MASEMSSKTIHDNIIVFGHRTNWHCYKYEGISILIENKVNEKYKNINNWPSFLA